MASEISIPPPGIDSLGRDLLTIAPWRRVMTLVLPFVCVGIYLACAMWRFWPGAVLALVYLSFITYGSISHDLVHRTLGIPRPLNELFLATIELLAFRSGHAYRVAHLHHHARFPHEDDIEGAAARMTLWRTILEGIIFQPKIMTWAMTSARRGRDVIAIEIFLIAAMLAACVISAHWTPIFVVYAVLMIMGGWIIPLVTSYIPHNADGRCMLTQTRLFRGKVASIIAMEHLYHLEHHLYPAVPHHNWAELGRRLDPYFEKAKVRPIVLGF